MIDSVEFLLTSFKLLDNVDSRNTL